MFFIYSPLSLAEKRAVPEIYIEAANMPKIISHISVGRL